MNEIEKLILLSKRTAKDIAPILGTTPARISEYKTGKRAITVRKLREWAQALNIPMKDLF